jgi:predicted nucleic acid-binding protein
MATLIDSSVLIAAERGQLNFDEIATRYEEEDVAISAVTASELLHGVHRAIARTSIQTIARDSIESLFKMMGH